MVFLLWSLIDVFFLLIGVMVLLVWGFVGFWDGSLCCLCLGFVVDLVLYEGFWLMLSLLCKRFLLWCGSCVVIGFVCFSSG